jgi:metallo-beta-lactamase family protein
MNIRFLGAARTVTGSAHLLEINGKRILMDYGLYQGRREEARRINENIPEHFRHLDAVILSHGHLDHCGRLPILTRIGYRGPIYCTGGTAEVARVVMTDSAEIQVEDADYINRRVRQPGEEPIKPLYTPSDASQVVKQFKHTKLMQRTELFDGVGFTLFDAGHILGSTYIVVDWKQDGKARNLLFTADIGRFNTPIINDPYTPPMQVDTIITESTYGGRLHGPMVDVEPEFEKLLKQVIETRSRLIIPSFAVGRTQTMLWYVEKLISEKKIPPIRLYVDSPMGVDLTQIYTRCKDYWDDQTRDLIEKKDLFGMKNVTLASSAQQSKEINADKGPCVIIASSPTCEFGRILHHLKASLEQKNDILLFVGWTPPGTLGRKLQEGATRVKVYDRFYNVRCQVKTLPGMSAHGDSDEMLRFLKPAIKPGTRAFVVHGEAEQFAARLIHETDIASATVPAPETSVIEDAAPITRRDAGTGSDGD